MKPTPLILLLCACVLGDAPRKAIAQDGAPVKTSGETKARHLLGLLEPPAILRQLAAADEIAGVVNSSCDTDEQSRVGRAVAGHVEHVLTDLADKYAQILGEDVIEQALTFYESEAGRHLRDKMPGIREECSKAQTRLTIDMASMIAMLTCKDEATWNELKAAFRVPPPCERESEARRVLEFIGLDEDFRSLGATVLDVVRQADPDMYSAPKVTIPESAFDRVQEMINNVIVPHAMHGAAAACAALLDEETLQKTIEFHASDAGERLRSRRAALKDELGKSASELHARIMEDLRPHAASTDRGFWSLDANNAAQVLHGMLGLQNFMWGDPDGNGRPDKWTRDFAGLYAMKSASGVQWKFSSLDLAMADREGMLNYPELGGKDLRRPYSGYWFKAMTTPPTGETGRYQSDEDGDGRAWTHPRFYAFCAYPAKYSPGERTFIVNELGLVYSKDLGPQSSVNGLDAWPGPADPSQNGWDPLK